MWTQLLVLLSRISGIFRGRRADEEFDAEIADHLDRLAADHRRQGLSPHEARLAARRDFGSVTSAVETQRETRGLPFLGVLAADIRYASRMLRNSPAFSAIAIFTIAIGIGINTTAFSVYDAVALKLLPVAHPGRMLRFKRWFENHGVGNTQYAFSFPEYVYFRDHARSFSGLIAASWPVPIAAETGPVTAQFVTLDYFRVLGLNPARGRLLNPGDASSAAATPVVLSYNFWRRRYALAPEITGKTLSAGNTNFLIVGVAPESFPGTSVPPQTPDFWAPVESQELLSPGRDILHNADQARYVILGRLAAPGGGPAAHAETALLMRQFSATRQERIRTTGITLERLSYFGNTDDLRFKALVVLFMFVVGLVLLIACANLANMLLARAAARQREFAVRLAIGAGRSRLIRQLLTESILLSLLGGAAGLFLSTWFPRFVSLTFLGPYLTETGLSLTPDARIFEYTLLLSLFAGLVFGLSPALQYSRPNLTSALKQEGAVAGGRISRSRFRSILIACQVAASMLLLIVAGLLLRGLTRSYGAQPGFETRGLYLINANYGTNQQKAAALEQRVYSRLAALPQVAHLTWGDAPMTGTWTPPIVVGTRRDRTLASYASTNYFETLGIPIVRGRSFTESEIAHKERLAVISENAARRFWPDSDPLGKHFQLDMDFTGKMREFTVIGIVRDIRYASLSRLDPAHVYLTADLDDPDWMLVRVRSDSTTALAAIRSTAAEVDRNLLTSVGLISLDGGPMRDERMLAAAYALLAVVLAVLALTLAGIGIYGVMSYLVNRRVKEIGVLMALGAGSGQVLRSVILQGLRPVIIGSFIGLIAAGSVSKLINATLVFPGSSDFLYGLHWWDPVTFVGLTAFLALIAALASAVPARRALNVDPAVALRSE